MIEIDTAVGSDIKLVCSRADLADTAGVVARAVSSRSSVQVLGGIHLRAEKSTITLSATDMEVSITSSLDAKVSSEGEAVVSGRVLLDAVRSLPSSESSVTIEQKSGTGQIEVQCGNASFRLHMFDARDFPRLPELVQEAAFKVDRAMFLETAARVARAASRDESRPVLTGILVRFESEEGKAARALVMAATDSYRLAVKETALEQEAPPLEAIVPARALGELARVVGDGDELELAIHENHAIFVSGRTTLATRRIDGQFPNYRQLIPETFAHTVKVNRQELLDVVRRVGIMAQRTSPIRLRFEEGALTVSAQTPDVGEASETIPVAYSGDLLEIGFNAEFLREGIDSVVSEEIELNLNNPLLAGLLRAEGDSFWYLIMPIRLAG
jgi:DNA polymerase-3 subunit beta